MKKFYFTILAFCFFGIANAQIVNIPDTIFKALLLSMNSINSNSDGEIQVSEALSVSNLNVSELNISSLTGIEFFTNLQELSCYSNQLTNLDVSGLTNLTSLYCSGNQLTNIDVSGLTNLLYLGCSGNQLTNLDVSGLTNLISLGCSGNQLTNLDVSGGLTNLTSLYCTHNQFTNLDLSELPYLINLDCNYNNQLVSLFIKNGTDESVFFIGNSNLQYICADESQLTDIQSQINSAGYGATCNVNSYCSFTPGGTFYTIQGNNKFDLNSNGCDTLDVEYPNLKLNFSDGTTNGNLISNTSGNYSIPVQAGTHMITPLLQNPTYFNVSPTTATVTFPVTTSPFVQDFCITANGVHNDLEINLLPTSFAVPGFDANYKIIYKNNGNQTQSGSINLNFNDDVLDLVTANPDTTSQSLNNLFWNFTNLLPFESREILVTLNLNSPMETPPLNSGDILSFNATITALPDETPLDNTFTLNQVVVNSYDPNDKTCLEGNAITPTQVGEYVHYVIRFENTGTFPAENIVVKDIIDTTKFDMATLFPVSGSHNFITKISDINKVEFIFQNINLPFDNANNDGYVAFKIKTKSTLALGNTFSNLANIYFDYNFPIITNTATTTVANPLSTQDFEFSNYFSIYPNPVKNSLNITSKQAIKVSSMSIYNTLGQVVQVVTNPTQTVDVSELRAGAYFVKIVSDNGVSGTKFVKE